MREKDLVLFQIPLSESLDGPLPFLKADIPKGVANAAIATVVSLLVEQNECDVLTA